MAHYKLLVITLLFLILLTLSGVGVNGTNFTIANKCEHTVWPGILSSRGKSTLLPATVFALQKGETKTLATPDSWTGRIWGRTLCEGTARNFSCVTGDCGSGELECSGSGPTAATTLAEFTLDGSQDFFDVSLVDGFNLPMVVVPEEKNCKSTGCVANLNDACPAELAVMTERGGAAVACNSACAVFHEPRYCCTGAYNSPSTCKPTDYSRGFKQACPQAYSYAFDDESSTFTCRHSDYLVTFCPNTSYIEAPPPASTSNGSHSHTDTSIVYKGEASPSEESGAPPSRSPHYVLYLMMSMSLTMVYWRLFVPTLLGSICNPNL